MLDVDFWAWFLRKYICVVSRVTVRGASRASNEEAVMRRFSGAGKPDPA